MTGCSVPSAPTTRTARPQRDPAGRTARVPKVILMSADTLPNTAGDEIGPRPATTSDSRVTVALDVVVPVYNEQTDLEPAVRRLHDYLSSSVPLTFRITIADNASTDRTAEIADRLAAELPAVTAVHLSERGRGRALNLVWSHSDAGVLAYMDVDLSTDLAALLPLVAPLISGHSDVAIGTRLHRGSRVVRGTKREFISRCYNPVSYTHLTLPTKRIV